VRPETALQIAASLDSPVELLPVLPRLFHGLAALGSDPTLVAGALQRAGLGPGARVIDLGCGKGAVALEVASALAAQVDGIDAFAPLVDEASAAAREHSLESRCSFRVGDLRWLKGEGRYDAALWIGLGPIVGDLHETMGYVRSFVRTGGLVAIDDEYARKPLEEQERARRALTAFGDQILYERPTPPWETRALNAEILDILRENARVLCAEEPAWTALAREFLVRQKRQSRTLETNLIPCLWVLQRGDG